MCYYYDFKRKLIVRMNKLFFSSSYYQSGMSKHAFCGHIGICCPALLIGWIKKYSKLAEELSLPLNTKSLICPIAAREAYKDEMPTLKKRLRAGEALSFSKLETESVSDDYAC